MLSSRSRFAAVLAAASLVFAGCSANAENGSADNAGNSDKQASKSIQVQDNRGTQTVNVPPKAVVATDNRTFQTLQDWGVELKAAPKGIMPETIKYKKDDSVVDMGTHNEPNLEAVVAAQPDLVINGQRFAKYFDDMKKFAPKAAVLDLDPKEDKPLDEELKRQTTVLGEVFDKQKDAEKLNGELDAAVKEAKEAYNPEQKVMAVNVSGGKIGYVAPKKGRTLGPLFDMLGLTPALEVKDSSNNHTGDDISVEAIAAANPDWILVMDRDAAISAKDSAEYKPAEKVLKESAALQNVKAVQEGHIVIMPADTYTNEGIQTYTKYIKELAKAFKK